MIKQITHMENIKISIFVVIFACLASSTSFLLDFRANFTDIQDAVLPGVEAPYDVSQGLSRFDALPDSIKHEAIIFRTALKKLNLNDRQESEIREIIIQFSDQGITLRKALKNAHDSLPPVLGAEQNPAVIEDVLDQIDRLKEKGTLLGTEVKISVLNVLSFEQEEKFY
ncbi:MAG: hypothetical protein CMI18_02720 [Opitutaceae bacterium]|nr:hypothetical protein [Opitutaceae bacterium]